MAPLSLRWLSTFVLDDFLEGFLLFPAEGATTTPFGTFVSDAFAPDLDDVSADLLRAVKSFRRLSAMVRSVADVGISADKRSATASSLPKERRKFRDDVDALTSTLRRTGAEFRIYVRKFHVVDLSTPFVVPDRYSSMGEPHKEIVVYFANEAAESWKRQTMVESKLAEVGAVLSDVQLVLKDHDDKFKENEEKFKEHEEKFKSMKTEFDDKMGVAKKEFDDTIALLMDNARDGAVASLRANFFLIEAKLVKSMNGDYSFVKDMHTAYRNNKMEKKSKVKYENALRNMFGADEDLLVASRHLYDEADFCKGVANREVCHAVETKNEMLERIRTRARLAGRKVDVWRKMIEGS